MTGSAVVIGLGNRSRGDDAAGIEVVRRVKALMPALDVTECEGDALTLIDAWDGAALAVVVDAARGGAPGTVRRLEGLDRLAAARPATTHGLGLADAARLAAALGRLPRRLVVYTISGAEFGPGDELGPAARAAVAPAAQRVVDEVGRLGQTRPGWR